MKFPLATSGFLLALLATCGALAPGALARGGRYAGPAPAPREPASPTSPAEAGVPAPQDDPCGPTPDGGVPALVAPAPTLGGLDGPRGRRVSRPVPGTTDWVPWYETNREGLEGLGRAVSVTAANPIFALGGASGPAVGSPATSLGSATLAEIRATVASALEADAAHWVHTRAAAYVALGRVADGPADVRRLLALLAEPGRIAYLRESALLGLGHLARRAPEERLPAPLLDKVREAVLAVLSDEGEMARTRGYAAVTLGLLANQPTTGAPDAGPATTRALFGAWRAGDWPEEAQVGLLLGLSLGDPRQVAEATRLFLAAAALRGRVPATGATCSSLVRAYAVHALGRLGGSDEARALARDVLPARDAVPIVRQAAALAAGALGERLPDARVVLVEALRALRTSATDPGSRRLAWTALGRILAAGAAEDDPAPLEAGAGRQLLLVAAESQGEERAFGALALGVALRAVGPFNESTRYQAFRKDAVAVLRAGATDRALDGHARAAFLLALGLAGDRPSADLLLALLRASEEHPDLRAYAALALGHLGEARAEVVRALLAALDDPQSDLLQMRAATALGLLGGGSAADRERVLDLLLAALGGSRTLAAKGQIALTLARIGDPRAVRPLAALLASEREAQETRAVACAALGLLGDQEALSTLEPLRADGHYLPGVRLVLELFDLL